MNELVYSAICVYPNCDSAAAKLVWPFQTFAKELSHTPALEEAMALFAYRNDCLSLQLNYFTLGTVLGSWNSKVEGAAQRHFFQEISIF